MNSRATLATKLAERDAAQARADAARAALARLQDAQAAEGPARAALANLDALAANAALEWARSGGNSAPPAVDTEKRDVLTRRLAEATAQAQAARAAFEPLNAELLAETAKLAELKRDIQVASAEVIADELAPVVADLAAANAKVARLKAQVAEGREMALQTIERFRVAGHYELTSPASRALERIDSAIRDALDQPAPHTIDAGGAHAAWASLFSRLALDATAAL